MLYSRLGQAFSSFGSSCTSSARMWRCIRPRVHGDAVRTRLQAQRGRAQ
jgi:hypothetical protein